MKTMRTRSVAQPALGQVCSYFLQLSDSSNDNDSYFHDPNSIPTSRHHHAARTDEQGYVIRRSVLEEGTRPEYIIPVGSADGVWGMIKRIGRFRGEGYLALWKGKIRLEKSRPTV